MTDSLLFGLTFVTALGCGLVAGVFFGFSTFIMKALGRLPAPLGIAAMQSINVTVITPVFMIALFGTGAVCILLAVLSLSLWQKPRAVYLLAGSLLYVIGTILVTIVFNVPRNDALSAVDATSAEGARVWAAYLTEWTAWNHVRTVAALAAAVLMTFALYLTAAD